MHVHTHAALPSSLLLSLKIGRKWKNDGYNARAVRWGRSSFLQTDENRAIPSRHSRVRINRPRGPPPNPLSSDPNIEPKLLPHLARQRRAHQAPGPIILFVRALRQRAESEGRGRVDGGVDPSVGTVIHPGEDQGFAGEEFSDAEVALAVRDLLAAAVEDVDPGLLRGDGVDAAAEAVEFPRRNHAGSVPDVGIGDWGAHGAVLALGRLFVGSGNVL